MLSLREAEERIRAALPAPRRERVSLAATGGRVLAGEVRAPFPLPRFTCSAMDGFAVRARDTAGAAPGRPVRLRVRGESAAGHPAPVRLGAGECVRCMTGAPLPEGADAVVVVEDTSGFSDGETVDVFRRVAPEEDVRVAGEEVPEGDVLLPAGSLVGPVERGLLASLGFARVSVFRRPAAVLLATGDEVRSAGEPLGPGEIHDANLAVLSDLLRQAGARVVRAALVRDDPEVVRARAEAALASADLLVLSGGVSKGRHDHVPEALARAGVEVLVHGIAQKPGKPMLFGVRDRRPVFGLPGNALSALFCAVRHVVPAVARMAGGAPDTPYSALLEAPFPRDRERHRYLPGWVRWTDGGAAAAPSVRTGSHMLTAALRSNAFLGAPAGPGSLPAGSPVEVWPVPWACGPARGPRAGGAS
ncbi:MAG: molybdopterin molybdotransferase MoeA [Planctomycetes bacterium]|nr:molybdopterin molybdotransferase MoeA [Planctomycetota bacterium]